VATTKVRGRMSAAKLRILAELGPRYGVDLDPDRPLADRLDAAFGRRADRLLDIGIGNGEATVAWAAAHPERDVVAAELHRPSVAATLAAVDGAGLANVRVAEVDVRTLLDQAGPGALHDVRVLFPDPWPKRRHHARRLVDAPFARALADVPAARRHPPRRYRLGRLRRPGHRRVRGRRPVRRRPRRPPPRPSRHHLRGARPGRRPHHPRRGGHPPLSLSRR
jgi:predicted RNA methylase